MPSLSRRRHAPKGPIKAEDPISETHRISEAKRCTAHSKRTGKPCGFAAIPGGTVCRYHGGLAPQVANKARERLRALVYPALAAYDELIAQHEFPTVRFAAAREVVNHEFGRPGESLEVNVKVDEEKLIERLKAARRLLAEHP